MNASLSMNDSQSSQVWRKRQNLMFKMDQMIDRLKLKMDVYSEENFKLKEKMELVQDVVQDFFVNMRDPRYNSQ